MRLILFTYFLLYSLIGYSQSQSSSEKVIIIEAYLRTAELAFLPNKNCLTFRPELPESPMANQILNKIIDDIYEYKEYEISLSQDGYEKKVTWTIESGSGQIKLLIETESIWLGRLIYRYIKEQGRQFCYKWLELRKREILLSEYETFTYKGLEDNKLVPKEFSSRTSGSYHTSTTKEKKVYTFPFFVPQPTASLNLPANFFYYCEDSEDIDNFLRKSLNDAGYYDLAYFSKVDGKGFVITTALERFNNTNGQKIRQNIKPYNFSYIFSIQEFLKSLIYCNRGYFRVFVFMVGGELNIHSYANMNPKKQEQQHLMGQRVLPNNLKDEQYKNNSNTSSNVTLLIYEFENTEHNQKIRQIKMDVSDGNNEKAMYHLIGSDLQQKLEWNSHKKP